LLCRGSGSEGMLSNAVKLSRSLSGGEAILLASTPLSQLLILT
jgi:hypothetical protein